jgi:hypothetical protein
LEIGNGDRVNEKKGTIIFTVAYAMNNLAQHKAEAWELISYRKEYMRQSSEFSLSLLLEIDFIITIVTF